MTIVLRSGRETAPEQGERRYGEGVIRCWPPLSAVVALAVVAACGSPDVSRSAAQTEPATSTSTTVLANEVTTTAAPTTTTVAPTTTTTVPIQLTGLFDDVAEAALLGPVPEGVPLGGAAYSEPALYDMGCHAGVGAVTPIFCEFGDLTSDTVVVFTGDSHAAQWFGALEVAARTNRWKLISMTKTSCPAADVTTFRREDGARDGAELEYPQCNEFRRNGWEAIRELAPDLVIYPMLTRYKQTNGGGLEGWRAGLGRSIQNIAGPGTKVLILGETPKTNGADIPPCIRANRSDVSKCSNVRSAAEFPKKIEMFERVAAEHGATFVNPVDWFCTSDVCPVLINGRIVYRDYNHVSDQFSRYRAPQMAAAIELALSGPDAF